jgi:hypothetical protein
MATGNSKSPSDQKRKTAPSPASKNKSSELSEAELGKVSGGNKGGDPCEGGELHGR